MCRVKRRYKGMWAPYRPNSHNVQYPLAKTGPERAIFWAGPVTLTSKAGLKPPSSRRNARLDGTSRALQSGDYLSSTFGARLLERRLDLLGLFLVHAFLDGLRRAFDEVLGFLQAEAGQSAGLP